MSVLNSFVFLGQALKNQMKLRNLLIISSLYVLSVDVILCRKKSVCIFFPYRTGTVNDNNNYYCDLMKVPHVQVMAKEEMTSI